jgi:hypothetical protein
MHFDSVLPTGVVLLENVDSCVRRISWPPARGAAPQFE